MNDDHNLPEQATAAKSPVAPGPSLASRTRELLQRHGLRPRKSFGQNFLLSEGKVRLLAEAAVGLAPGALVVEIGPGLGALTVALAQAGARVVACELDRWLEPPLREVLALWPQVTVHFADFLQVDLAELTGGQPFVAAGNLPYQITSPLLEKVLAEPGCRGLVVTVQREVADRLRATPGSKAYGPLTLFARCFCEPPQVLCQLPPGDFLPPPGVQSTALRLVRRDRPPFARPGVPMFLRTVRAAFNHRRKSLQAGLPLATVLGATREQVAGALLQADLDGGRRAETLDLDELARLAEALEQTLGEGESDD